MAAEEYGALNAELAEPEELAAEVVLAYDGLSPTAKVEETEAGAKITVVDKHGTTTATVKNGKDGATGAPGAHIGPEAPTNGEKLWVDTDEAPEESETEGGTQIDVVAKAGQLLSVAEVDADGKPTKWQAVDLPQAETPNFAANEGEKGYIEGRTHYVDEKGVIHKLPNMFIDADWMATKQDGGAGKTVFIPEQTVSDGLWKNLQADLVEGDVYAVEVNGVLYKCKCLNDGDGTLYLGNGTLLGATAGNNEPFCISWFSGVTGGTFYNDGTLEAPIGIKVTNWQDVVYNKLPEEYLSENVVKGEGGKVAWDNVSDKPFSQDAGELLFSKAVTFATDAAATTGVRLTGVSLSLTNGAEYWLEVNGNMIKCRWEKVDSMEWELHDSEGNRWLRKVVTAWYMCSQSAGTFAYNLYGLSENIVLDPKYIPNSIARKSDIPEAGGAGVDVTASVGQTIIVEEVDADGKPTKWKSADYQPRTHWTEAIEILPETAVEVDPDEGMGVIPVDFTVEGGKYYTVKYNGVEYADCVCTAAEGQFFLGNLGAMDENFPITEHPFVVAYTAIGEDDSGNMIMEWAVAPIDGSASVTLSIAEVKHTPIPAPYLTNAFPYYVELSAEYYEDGAIKSLTCAESGQTLLGLYDIGRDIVLRKPEYKGDSNITSWTLYRLVGFSKVDNGTIALSFTVGQLRDEPYLPTISIGIMPDGQVTISSSYH